MVTIRNIIDSLESELSSIKHDFPDADTSDAENYLTDLTGKVDTLENNNTAINNAIDEMDKSSYFSDAVSDLKDPTDENAKILY